MAIVKMKRLRAIALEEQRDELLARLLHVGCVEVTEPEDCLTDPEWTALLAKDTGAQGAVKAQITAVQSALKALDKYAPVKGSLFTKRSDISEADFFDAARQEKAQAAAAAINDCVAEISQLYTEENRYRSARDGLVPWETMSEPLDSGLHGARGDHPGHPARRGLFGDHPGRAGRTGAGERAGGHPLQQGAALRGSAGTEGDGRGSIQRPETLQFLCGQVQGDGGQRSPEHRPAG